MGSKLLCRAVIGGLLVGGLTVAAAGPARDEQPRLASFLLVTLDTLRADHLGAYGYPRPTSPSLDSFATTATLFEDVTCSMPTTLPSHLTILTGLTPLQHRVLQNGVVPPPGLVSLFDLLSARGHRTAAVVSAKVLDARYLTGLGLDHIYYGDGRTPTALQLPAPAVTAMAERWLDAFADEPFALWLHFYDPHEPYDPPAEFAARFVRHPDSWIGPSITGGLLSQFNQDPERRAALTTADRQHIVDLSNAELCAMDEEVGKLLGSVARRGLMDRTVIVIVGDHGQAHGEHDFWGHGLRLLEPVVKVPLMIRLPGQDEGRRVAAPVETLDLMPTLVDLFGLVRPPGLSGRSLTPLLRGDPLAPPPFRIVEKRHFANDPTGLGMALYGRDWKLTYFREHGVESIRLGHRDGSGGLDGDVSLSPRAPELVLLGKLLAQRSPLSVPPAVSDDESRNMLRALGYVQ